MDSRRNFLGKVASGLAGTLAALPARVLGANERVRVGIIGFGDRGAELLNHVRACPNAAVVGISDVFTGQLEKARLLAPDAALHLDYRRMLDDPSMDAVLIATPQHLHAEHFCASLDAAKHVYQEKTMAFTVEHAKRMRAAFRKDGGKRTVQIGHQACSFGHMRDVRQFLAEPGRVGRITAINMQMYRNTPRGKAPWSRTARITPEVNAENIAWQAFLGEAPAREFDANRYMNWRLFEDYSGGSVHENMSHQLGFWYQALGLQIPRAAAMTGGVYLWKDGREVPDTMSVTLEQPEEILINWISGFGNNQPGVSEEVLGDLGTISRGTQVRYTPQKVNRPLGNEMTGRSAHVPHVHMQNFFESIRGVEQPNCPFETGFRVSIACRMAIDSHRLARTLKWDAKKEEMV